MGTTYTYLVRDLRTGTILDELPLSGCSSDKKLNDSGSLRGRLHVDDPEIRIREPRVLTEPGRTAIYVDRDGDLLWGGIVWTSRYTSSDGVLEIGATDFLSYFDHSAGARSGRPDQNRDVHEHRPGRHRAGADLAGTVACGW